MTTDDPYDRMPDIFATAPKAATSGLELTEVHVDNTTCIADNDTFADLQCGEPVIAGTSLCNQHYAAIVHAEEVDHAFAEKLRAHVKRHPNGTYPILISGKPELVEMQMPKHPDQWWP